MIVWFKKNYLTDRKKKEIENFIKEFQTNDIQVINNLPKPNEEGGFSKIFFLDDIALKRTTFWDYDDLYDPDFDVYLELHSDHEVLRALQDIEETPILYGYSKDLDWVIMERLHSSSLEDLILNGEELSPELEERVIQFIASCLNRGWYPNDLRFRSIYPNEDGNLKIIDYNMFQSLSHLAEEGVDISIFQPSRQYSIKFWNELKEIELRIINDYRRFLK